MLRFISELYRIVSPFGRRRMAILFLWLVISALAQMVALFSVLPFLSAATDPDAFRTSRIGQIYVYLFAAESDTGLIVTVGICALVLLITGNLIMTFVDHLRGRYAFYIGHSIRMSLVRQFLARRYEFFLTQNSAGFIKNLQEDTYYFSHTLLLPSLDVAARSILAIGLLVTLLILEPFVFAVGSTLIGLYVLLVIMPLRRSATKINEMVKTSTQRVYFEIGQMLSGIKPIIAFDAQPYFVERINSPSQALAKLMAYSTLYPSIPKAGLEILVFGCLIGWVLIEVSTGGNLVSLMPRVGLIALLAYRLMPALQQVVSLTVAISLWRQAMDELAQRISEQKEFGEHNPLALAHDRPPPPLNWTNEIAFESVSFKHKGAEHPSVQDLTFSIKRGEKVAFVGSTGSGKSTLIDLILGLLIPSAGRILVDGAPLDAERRRQWRATVGYVPQDLFLLDAAIEENIAFGVLQDAIDSSLVRKAANTAQAEEFIGRNSSLGFQARVGERGVRLSGGQRQRLAIARALYRAPTVLVMDEATSALDPETELKVISEITGTDSGITLISVAHRLSTVEKSDRIFFMEKGRIVDQGTMSQLMEKNPEFRRFAAQTARTTDGNLTAPPELASQTGT